MTTWNDALKLINPSNTLTGNSYLSDVDMGDLGTFAKLFDISYYGWEYEFSKRMLKHWVYSWVCTDTRGRCSYLLSRWSTCSSVKTSIQKN